MKITMKSRPNLTKKGGEKRMKYSKTIITIVAAGLALGTYINSQADENVRMTKHNLVANTNIGAQGTTEVCIFCHTPHGGRTDVAGGAAPLWNRTIPASSGYTLYTSPNFDSLTNNSGQPRGVSIACLSCHDGTIAFDSLVNLPGSGGYKGATGGRANWTFSGALVDSDGSFKDSGSPPNPFPNLGQDLSNDHPISMRICNDTTAHDPQFDEACGNSSVAPGNSNILRISRTGISALPGDIRNTIRAYKSDPSGDTTGWYIECASCHNPHEASRSTDTGATATDTNNSRFLRLPSWNTGDEYYTNVNNKVIAGGGTAGIAGDRNAGSLLCLSCHQK